MFNSNDGTIAFLSHSCFVAATQEWTIAIHKKKLMYQATFSLQFNADIFQQTVISKVSADYC